MDNYNKLFMIIRKTDLLNYDEKDELHLYLMNLKEQVKKQKEVIDKATELHNNFAKENAGLIFENDELITFMNNLLEILEDEEVLK